MMETKTCMNCEHYKDCSMLWMFRFLEGENLNLEICWKVCHGLIKKEGDIVVDYTRNEYARI